MEVLLENNVENSVQNTDTRSSTTFRKDSIWSPALDARLKAMWEAGHSGSECGNCLGVSRSAAIARASRKGFKRHLDDTFWSDGDTAILKHLWDLGLSNNEIAEKLTRRGESGLAVTRGAIITKANSLGLKKRKRLRIRTAAKPSQPGAKPYVTPVVDLEIPFQQRKTLLELENGDCRWPVGDPGQPGFFFCGGKIVGDHSYCAAHHQRAHEYYKPRGTGFRFAA